MHSFSELREELDEVSADPSRKVRKVTNTSPCTSPSSAELQYHGWYKPTNAPRWARPRDVVSILLSWLVIVSKTAKRRVAITDGLYMTRGVYCSYCLHQKLETIPFRVTELRTMDSTTRKAAMPIALAHKNGNVT